METASTAKSGLLQFQYAIPWESAREGTIAILGAIAKSGLASFLAVLKAFGDVPLAGSHEFFPQPGITLALDFPIKPNLSFPLFERLADMTRDFGGRLYPAKDARHGLPHSFQAFYPQWEQFARFRDPMLTSSFWERVTGDQSHYEHTAHHRRQCRPSLISRRKDHLRLEEDPGPRRNLRHRRSHLPCLGRGRRKPLPCPLATRKSSPPSPPT